MNRHLYEVLISIADENRGNIFEGSRNYIEINIGKRAEAMGYKALKEKYKLASAVVPLKHPEKGMKVRIDGRTFVNYTQYDQGIAVPAYVAKDAGLPHKAFIPNDSMILNNV